MEESAATELTSYKARCDRIYNTYNQATCLFSGAFSGLATLLFTGLSFDDIPAIPICATAIAVYVAWRITQSFACKFEQRYYRELKQQIHQNLFQHGLWLHVLEGPSTGHSLLGIKLSTPAGHSLNERLGLLYSAYPRLCRKLGLEPFTTDYWEKIEDPSRYDLSQYYTNQLWRPALAHALLEELVPGPQDPLKERLIPPARSAGRSARKSRR